MASENEAKPPKSLQNEFLKAEYAALREEIRDAKLRTFKTHILALAALPATLQLATSLQVRVLLLALPFIVFALAAVYLADCYTILRCGRYIREHIERLASPGGEGWEAWLESDGRYHKRSMDRFLTYTQHLLFFLSFVLSVVFALKHSFESYGFWPTAAVCLSYASLVIWFFKSVSMRVLFSVSTIEPEPHGPQPN